MCTLLAASAGVGLRALGIEWTLIYELDSKFVF